jgi:diacylglycerol kinase (ATP)
MSLLKSFRNAWRGFVLAIRTQRNMKIHAGATVIVLVAGFYFSFTVTEWCLVILCIGLVMGLEVLNTSIEELVNFVSPEKRNEAKRIKDLAAGAVLVAAIAAFAIGLIVIFNKTF